MSRYDIAARYVSADGTTVLHELHDCENGIELLAPLPDEPEWNEDDGRVYAFYMNGSAPSGPPRILDGQIPVRVKVSGVTYAEMHAKVEALKAAWRSEPVFFYETEVEGVTTRYIASRVRWSSTDIDHDTLDRHVKQVTMLNLVQPSPEIGGES